jgi:hypothetical protein
LVKTFFKLVILSAARAIGEAGSKRKSKDPENVSSGKLLQGVFFDALAF